MLENFQAVLNIKDKKYMLEIVDTAGQEDMHMIRLLSFPRTKCVILCYSVVNESSFDNLFSFWLKELEESLYGVPIVLCGNKLDLKESKPNSYISNEEALEAFKKVRTIQIGLQCSAHDFWEDQNDVALKRDVHQVFKNAIRLGMKQKLNFNRKTTCCTLI